MTNTKQKVRKLVFIGLLIAPVFILLVTFSTLTGSASTARDDETQIEQVPVWQATPTADRFETPTPAAPDNLRTQDGNVFTLFLPIITKFPGLFREPLLAVYGPITDPGIPSLDPRAQSTVVVDPGSPTPPTPAPGEPTWTPTPGPGTPSATPTAKPSFTPTVMPTATEVLVPGGGVDTDSERAGWIEYSLRNYDLLFDEGDGLPQAPGGAYEGDGYIWLGGIDSEISYVQRSFTVPSSYRRYYLGYFARFQSYDPVCATTKYASMLQADRDEMLAGQLRHATAGTLDIFGVDLGGTIICVNKSGRTGCNNDAVKDLSGGRKAVYVVYYDLCNVANGTGWTLSLFPISTASGGPELAGEEITVQIKTITDSQLSSSMLVDNVSFFAGPPLPTPTPTPFGASIQTQETVLIGDPVLAPDIVPEMTGAQIVPAKTTETEPLILGAVWQK